MEDKKLEFLIAQFITCCGFYIRIVQFCHSSTLCVQRLVHFQKHRANICMTYEMLAADVVKHFCYDVYLASDSDLSLIFWPRSFWGKGQVKDHSFGLCMDH